MKYINKDRYEVYPFDFEMVVTYTVDDEGFTQQYDIKNIDNKNMPYTFCLHTTFVEPDGFMLPIAKRQEHDPLDIPTGRYVELTEQEKLSKFSSAMKTCRILVNTPSSHGGIGDLYNFRLEPSLTLGCGSWGGNAVSGNVGVENLLNYKTVAERR